MAKKYESQIDSDEFIRSFREDSSSLSSLKRITEATQQESVTPEGNNQLEGGRHPNNKDALTDLEQEYERLFFKCLSYYE